MRKKNFFGMLKALFHRVMSLLQRDDVESSSVKARHYHSQLNRFWAAVHQVHHLNNETKITRIEYGPDSLHAISRSSRLFVVISWPWHSTKNKILSETAYFRQRQSFRCNIQPKVIRDSNLDFRIDPDPGVHWITLKIFWIHSLVGVSPFAKLREQRPMT